MQKNTVMFVVFSTLFIMVWYMFFMPKPPINQSALNEKNQIAAKDEDIDAPRKK